LDEILFYKKIKLVIERSWLMTRTGLCQAAFVDTVLSKYTYYLIDREAFKENSCI